MTILVVEDHRPSAEALSRLLELSGHEVHLAFTAAGARDTLLRVRPDLVILDLGLPDATGHQVARSIRDSLYPPPVLVGLSAWDPDPSEDGVFDHRLMKPLDLADLLRITDGA